ncbi:TPA: site-specific integrase [Vibrio vulnificus]
MIRRNTSIHQPATVRCKISDAQIRKYAKMPAVKQLKDERASLYLRFRKNREQGSWILMEYKNGKQQPHVIGKYPSLSVAHVFDVVSHFLSDLSTGTRAHHNEFQTVDELLVWYLDRETRAGHLARERIISLKSMIEGHLIPHLHGKAIAGLQHKDVEKQLMKPLREANYSINYIRTIFQAMKVAFNKAKKLRLLSHNPLNDMTLTDFVTARVEVRGCRLRPSDTGNILQAMDEADPFARVLALMMLSHGTRIGETRLAKWCHICFVTKRWTIPKSNTKTRREIVYPLTDEMVAVLQSFRDWQLENNYKGNNVFPLSKRDKEPVHRVRATELVRSIAKGQWSAHDLRKLARTIWADIGIDYLVGETLLNHAKGKLDQAYIHTHIELQKSEALKTYHQWLKNCWRTCYQPTFQKS